MLLCQRLRFNVSHVTINYVIEFPHLLSIPEKYSIISMISFVIKITCKPPWEQARVSDLCWSRPVPVTSAKAGPIQGSQ